MLTGFNILICGSSNITIDHIKAIKKKKNLKITGIYSRNKLRVEEISRKYNLKIIENLDKEKLINFDIAVITSSSSNHLKYIKILSNYIKKIIVEKPIVINLNELNILKDIKLKKNLFIKEISLFDTKPKKTIFNKITINVKKKRNYDDFKNFKNEIDIYKSPIFNHLPHWFDAASLYLGSTIELDKVKFEKFDKNLQFHKKISLDLFTHNKQVKINIDLNHDKNFKNELIFNHENELINLFSIPINFLIGKLNFNSFIDTKDKVVKLEKFYKNFCDEKDFLNQDDYIYNLSKKITFIDKIWQLSKIKNE